MNRSEPRTRHTAASIDAFRRIVRALRMADQRTQGEAGISAAQLYVLSSLEDGAASSLTELGERTHTDRSSVADVVERLAARGLVSRDRSGSDRRRTEVRITVEGRALLDLAPRAPTALLLAGLDVLSPLELEGLSAGLLRLTGAMGLAAGPAPMLFEDEGEQGVLDAVPNG